MTLTTLLLQKGKLNMEMNELKLGDLVMESKKPYKVMGLKDGIVTIESLSNYAVFEMQPYMLSPMPLTKEILEKNEWEYTQGFYRLGCSALCADDDLGAWNYYYMGFLITVINSVHELQHILWAIDSTKGKMKI